MEVCLLSVKIGGYTTFQQNVVVVLNAEKKNKGNGESD